MNIEPPNLGAPLRRRDLSKYRLAVMAGLAAWLWHHPTSVPQAAISFFVGGAIYWLAFVSSISHRFANHPVPLVRGLWAITIVVSVVWLMQRAIPYLHALV